MSPSFSFNLVVVPHSETFFFFSFRFLFFFFFFFFLLSHNNRLDEGDKATHFLLRLTPSLTPIGTIRASRSSSAGTTKQPYYKLSRLAVLKEYRRYRFGRALVQRLHDWVAEDAIARGITQQNDKRQPDVVEIISHSQIPVKGFYVK
jgi:GNAT superfamily N-acetyltransferase